MTDTTHEAPERIWLQLGAGDEGTHTWADHQVGWDDEGEYEPEYIRADLVQAAVAAKLREAAADVSAVSMDGDHLAERILALITPDAQAALDRVVAGERERIVSIYRKLSTGSAVGAGDGDTFAVRYVDPEQFAAAIREGGE